MLGGWLAASCVDEGDGVSVFQALLELGEVVGIGCCCCCEEFLGKGPGTHWLAQEPGARGEFRVAGRVTRLVLDAVDCCQDVGVCLWGAGGGGEEFGFGVVDEEAKWWAVGGKELENEVHIQWVDYSTGVI